MTFGCPPSMMATQLLVVPRSIPMILAMIFILCSCGNSCLRETWGWCRKESTSARGRGAAAGRRRLVLLGRRFGDGDEGRPEHPIVDQIALLIDGHDGVRRLPRFD